MKTEIKRYLEENNNEEVGPTIRWDVLKVAIRRKIIDISSNEKKIRQQKQNQLEEDLKNLSKELSKILLEGIRTRIEAVKKELNNLNMQEIQQKLIFTKQKYYEAGGKSLKLLAFKLRKQQTDRTIHKIYKQIGLKQA